MSGISPRELNEKYQALRKVVANSTKKKRASILRDAINYINELKCSVEELELLVEKKRCLRERLKKLNIEEEGIHRKSKNIEVDVRIIDDEVTVKLVQQKRINCLLFVSKVLDELQLDLHHVDGGLVGDYYSFSFKSKICEGSIVHANAVANKLIEVVDEHYAAIPPTNNH